MNANERGRKVGEENSINLLQKSSFGERSAWRYWISFEPSIRSYFLLPFRLSRTASLLDVTKLSLCESFPLLLREVFQNFAKIFKVFSLRLTLKCLVKWHMHCTSIQMDLNVLHIGDEAQRSGEHLIPLPIACDGICQKLKSFKLPACASSVASQFFPFVTKDFSFNKRNVFISNLSLIMIRNDVR